MVIKLPVAGEVLPCLAHAFLASLGTFGSLSDPIHLTLNSSHYLVPLYRFDSHMDVFLCGGCQLSTVSAGLRFGDVELNGMVILFQLTSGCLTIVSCWGLLKQVLVCLRSLCDMRLCIPGYPWCFDIHANYHLMQWNGCSWFEWVGSWHWRKVSILWALCYTKHSIDFHWMFYEISLVCVAVHHGWGRSSISVWNAWRIESFHVKFLLHNSGKNSPFVTQEELNRFM